MKSKDLVRVIRAIVQQEIKKELPTALSQVFRNLMSGSPTSDVSKPKKDVTTAPEREEDKPIDEMSSLKSQLQEMFTSGAPVASKRNPLQNKQYTKNPLINEILNQTRSTSEHERANGQSAARFSMTPAAVMASAYEGAPSISTVGIGEMMEGEDLSFMNNIPGMPGSDSIINSLPTNGGQMISENQAPLGNLPESVSALDIKNHPALPDSIKNVLKRDYRSLVRAMDKKK